MPTEETPEAAAYACLNLTLALMRSLVGKGVLVPEDGMTIINSAIDHAKGNPNAEAVDRILRGLIH